MQIAFVLMALVATSITSVANAQAFESPLKKIAESAKEKLQKTKKIEIYNGIEEKSQENKDETKNKKSSGKKEKKNEDENKPHLQQIEEAVEFASKKTGVRKDFLMGMLVVESDLGRNTGACSYREVEEGAEKAYQNGQLSQRACSTFIERREKIKGIAEKIGRDYEDVRVSCNPSRYAGTGGAMGIPQFMPDTWLLFEDKISEIVGKENPDPWNVKDGVVAMALLLADTRGVTDHNYYAERNAAKMYLSGTTSWQYDWYANQILYWASNYKRLLG